MVKLPFVPGGDKQFYELLGSEAANLKDAAHALSELMTDYDALEERAANISALEHKGDEIIHAIMRKLHSTFVTPLDRGDIARLAEELDNVVDHIEEVAIDMHDFKVAAPTPQAVEVARVLYEAGAELEKAVKGLPNMGRKKKEILDLCVKISTLEEEADKIGRGALIALFTNGQDFIEVMKWREVYHHLEEAADSCQGAAIVLEGIVLEYA
jgi:predicted phosphate transport protein (TIGR00153 family)